MVPEYRRGHLVRAAHQHRIATSDHLSSNRIIRTPRDRFRAAKGFGRNAVRVKPDIPDATAMSVHACPTAAHRVVPRCCRQHFQCG